MACITEVTKNGTRLEQLKELALILAESIDSDDESHSMAQLARQYRETIREIAELESDDDNSDPIAQIIANHDSKR